MNRRRGRPALDRTGRCCGACGTQVTPLWRKGPQGAHWLCNACGQRFSKGRRLEERYTHISQQGNQTHVGYHNLHHAHWHVLDCKKWNTALACTPAQSAVEHTANLHAVEQEDATEGGESSLARQIRFLCFVVRMLNRPGVDSGCSDSLPTLSLCDVYSDPSHPPCQFPHHICD
jgi:hypothetical protein